jgi:hypothetical protein
MTENDNSGPGRTIHFKMVSRQADFSAQSSVLIFLTPDTRHLKPVLLKEGIDKLNPHFVNYL